MDESMSKQLLHSSTYIIWYSEGDELPYWISCKDGYEIDSFNTAEQCYDAFEMMERKIKKDLKNT